MTEEADAVTPEEERPFDPLPICWPIMRAWTGLSFVWLPQGSVRDAA